MILEMIHQQRMAIKYKPVETAKIAIVRNRFRIIKGTPPSNLESVIELSTFSESKLLKGENKLKMMNLYKKSPTELPKDNNQFREVRKVFEIQLLDSAFAVSMESGKKLPKI